MELLQSFWFLLLESAPYLLLGLFLAGVIKQLIPEAFIKRIMGEKSSVVTAALIGTPLPLCSCSVIPTAMGIRRAGASKASTASFMVATPETGVDSIGITYALMGPVMAIARPVAAITSAIMAGLLVRSYDEEIPINSSSEEEAHCCDTKPPENEIQQSIGQKLLTIGRYGYGKLLADFMDWLIIGLLFAAVIKTYVPESFFLQYGSGVGAMVIVVLISIPMYICATASTPIAAGLMLSGFSPGAALVFMLTGPASNVATLMVIKNELGHRSLIAYLIGVIFTAIVMGLMLDNVLLWFDLSLSINLGSHGEMTSILYQVSAVILVLLMLRQYWLRWRNKKSLFAFKAQP
jgi:uncharacterized membrane protein YraQ (UPF0718 family)